MCTVSSSIADDLGQSNKQGTLLPEQEGFLAIPILAIFKYLEVKLPKQSSKNKAHFSVREASCSAQHTVQGSFDGQVNSLLADAIPGASGKRLKHVFGVIAVVIVAKPAFRYKAVGVTKVGLAVECCPVRHRYPSLRLEN